MSYRLVTNEIDLAGFASPSIDVTGFMVIRSPRGRADKPILCESEKDVLKHFWEPSSTYPDLFEAVAYCRKAPCYITAPVNTDATYGGMDVRSGVAAAFGSGITAEPDDYTYTDNTISHSFFASSQYDDDLQAVISHTSGTDYQFAMTLYRKKIHASTYEEITTYNYSLQREKDAEGRGLYILDVFTDNPYVIPKINSNFTLTSGIFDSFVASTVTFDGGSRGSTPSEAQITAGWAYAQSTNKYPHKILMDPIGNDQTTVNTVINTYNPYAHGIIATPFGQTSVSNIVTARSSLSSDNVSKYCNWVKIKDNYNDGYAWVSSVGSIGGQYVLSSQYSYGAESPAGINESGRFGGQISDWEYIETELDFSDANLQTLDEAQINPFIIDKAHGMMAYGDKTMITTNTDTSYVGARRLYNYIIENIAEQILRKQEFKINDAPHRRRAKVQVDNFLAPIISDGYLREVYTLCDETNNTDDVLDRREFRLAVYEKVTVNTQKVLFDFIRVGQAQVLAELLP